MADLLAELDALDTLVTDFGTGMTKKNPLFAQVEELRSDLGEALAKARQIAANSATPLFIHGNTTLVQVNKKLQEDIHDLASFEANIEAIKGVIDSATEFLAIFAP